MGVGQNKEEVGKGTCLPSTSISCSLSTVHFPELSFTLKYRFLSNCFTQKLKSAQQRSISPGLPSQEEKLLTSVWLQRKMEITVLNSQGCYEDKFIQVRRYHRKPKINAARLRFSVFCYFLNNFKRVTSQTFKNCECKN